MYKVSGYLIVVGCKQSKKYRTIANTLKDYFNGMPYIPYTGYDKKTTYYILPHTTTIVHILKSLYDYIVFIEGIDIMAFATYVYAYENFTSASYHVMVRRTYSKILPPNIEIRKINKEKLKLFLSKAY